MTFKEIVSEAYASTQKKQKRYIKIYVKREVPQTDAGNDTSGNTVSPGEMITITLQNIEYSDAKELRDTMLPKAKVFTGTVPSKPWIKVPIISFQIPDKKFAKWIKAMMPKVQAFLEQSVRAEYPNADTLADDILETFHNTASEETKKRAVASLMELRAAVYKAIKENRWDDAVAMYKKAINLVARIYGHQLSPGNVQSIYAQAEKAGIRPGDRGKATNSFWEDGTEKFWPTFVRSAKSWKKDFGRTVKDEPKMQYQLLSGMRLTNDADTIQAGLSQQGYKNTLDLSAQQRDAARTKGLGAMYHGVGYDISDTEGPDDFFNAPGLLNNLDGTLTDAAKADNEAWLQKIKELKAEDENAALTDSERERELMSTEAGQAQIYMNAIERLSKTPKKEGGWEGLEFIIAKGKEPIRDYLETIYNVAKAKLTQSGWKNPTNIDKLAQAVTAGISCYTVGKNLIPQMGYDLSHLGDIFSSQSECESSIFSAIDTIISSLNAAVTDSEREAALNNAVKENKLFRCHNIMERMDNLYNDDYRHELYEGLIRNVGRGEVMNFLGQLGLSFNKDTGMNKHHESDEDGENR